MDWMGELIKLVGVMGFGGLLGSMITLRIQRSHQLTDRRQQQMREAYAGLLRSGSERPLGEGEMARVEGEFRYWIARSLLACPQDSMERIWQLNQGGRADLQVNRDFFVLMMRNDLESVE